MAADAVRASARRTGHTMTNTGSGLDNANYDLVHALSVRAAAAWHEQHYERDTACDSCVDLFERLRNMDQEATALLSTELMAHIQANKFPIDLTD